MPQLRGTKKKYEEVANDCKDSEIFKMNLYPIAFPNTDDGLWDKYGLTKITGLPSKEIYRTWCFLHRFPAINKQVTNYSPKYIIATGISYLTDFVVCFSGEKSDEMIHKEEIKPQSEANKSTRNFYWRRLNQKTILVVTPFFGGPNGMNSDYLLQQLGERIRNLNTN